MTMTKAEIVEMAEKTSDAYSFDRFTSWEACVKVLDKLGLTPLEVEAVLRSKWTRWASDSSEKPYGRATSKDLERWVKDAMTHDWDEGVHELTVGTFGYTDREEVEVVEPDSVPSYDLETKAEKKKPETIWVGSIPDVFGYGLMVWETSEDACKKALKKAYDAWAKECRSRTFEKAFEWYGGRVVAVEKGKGYYDNFGS